MAEQHSFPRLNLPSVNLRARHAGGQIEIWEPRRGRYIVLTPEEWVRQHVINMLITTGRIPSHNIVCEYPVPLNGQPQRADIVAMDNRAKPLIVVECKAADVSIGDDVLAQAVRYNSVLKARYVMITNGLQHFCYRCENDRYAPCQLSELVIAYFN